MSQDACHSWFESLWEVQKRCVFFFCAAPVMSQRWCGNFTQQLSVPEHSPHSHWGLGRWLEDRLKVSKAEAWTMDGEITVHMAYGDFEARDL